MMLGWRPNSEKGFASSDTEHLDGRCFGVDAGALGLVEETAQRRLAFLAEFERVVVDVHAHEFFAEVLLQAPAVLKRVLDGLVLLPVGDEDAFLEAAPDFQREFLAEALAVDVEAERNR